MAETSSPSVALYCSQRPAGLSHIASLDGVRGLAIIAVFLAHYVGAARVERLGTIGYIFSRLCGLGWVGVELFFVLSGFLITRILINSRDRPDYFRSFYGRRSLRIFPLYYFALFLTFIVLPGCLGRGSRTYAEEHQAWFWLYSSNVLWTIGGQEQLGTSEVSLVHFWSLAVEEQFYLIWPSVVLLCATNRRLAYVAAGIMLGTIVVRPSLYPYIGGRGCYSLTPCRLDGLSAGSLLAIASFDRTACEQIHSNLKRLAIPAVAAFLAIILLRGTVSSRDRGIITFGYPMITLASVALISFAIDHRTELLTGRILSWLGRRSYGIYVYHGLLDTQFRHLVSWLDSIVPLPLSIPIALLIGIAVVGMISEVSWKLLEKPILNLKRFF